MKTPDEIKKGLEDGVPYHTHKGEAYLGYIALAETQHKMSDALAYMQQLEAANAELLTQVERLEQERDALLEDIRGRCRACKHRYVSSDEEPCSICIAKNTKQEIGTMFEWRGVKGE